MQDKLADFFRKAQSLWSQFLASPNIKRFIRSSRHSFAWLREYTRVHQAIIWLTAFILFSNALVVRAANEVPQLPDDVIVSDPYSVADTVRLLSPYTPNIDEDADTIASSLEERVNGSFISTNPLIATLPGETDEPEPKPTTQVAQDRKKDIKYTVQIGDTISGIGGKFGVKVASITLKNDISDVDSIKPGQELLIPAQDVSDKAIKAAEERKVASDTLKKTGKETKKIVSTAVRGGYGLATPIRHNGISRRLVGGHTGIDYRASTGTPVVAAADGIVVIGDESGWNGGYGKTVLLSHSGGMTTRYAHLNDSIVRPGQAVSRGEVIGYSGNTGRSTGPHLHFELRVGGRAVDPGT